MPSLSIAIGYNTSHYVWLFRSNLIKALLKMGYKVTVLAPKDEHTEKIIGLGANHIDVPMKMNKNPITDFFLFLRLRKLLNKLNPDVYLGYTIKPNVYGSLAAANLGIPVINNIAGLGATFIGQGLTTKLVKILYRLGLSQSAMVFFQNPDDKKMFLDEGIVQHDRYDLLPGSGVDLKRFEFPIVNDEATGGKFRFLLIGRMLWDKGVGEFVEAARKLKKQHPQAEFCLLGGVDIDNPSAISRADVNKWVEEGVVTYLGYSDDVISEIKKSQCVVLPSYREGLPRTMLEASALGRPLITTDTVGCRETVDHGVNGYLCKLKDAGDLANKMRAMIELSEEERLTMGRAGRKKVEREYDETIVINKYLKIVEDLARQVGRNVPD